MQFQILERIPAETIHFYEPATDTMLLSRGRRLQVRSRGITTEFALPLGPAQRIASTIRLGRRALRLDKMNAVFTADRRAVVVLYQGHIYRCDLERGDIRRTGTLRQCRNVLHGGIAVTADGAISFGEYGANPRREAVPVWSSRDDGHSWAVVHEFPAGSIKHVHGIYPDPFTDRVWIPTGDFAGECFLYEADTALTSFRRHGDGTQIWRPVSIFFEKDHLVWGMDSQIEVSSLQVFDRRTGTLTRGQDFPGPVWYAKRLDGVSVLQTTCEVGAGVLTDSAHLFVSTDNRAWTEVAQFRKDAWPMHTFKFGVISFAEGEQSAERFALSGEALSGFDGVSFIARLG